MFRTRRSSRLGDVQITSCITTSPSETLCVESPSRPIEGDSLDLDARLLHARERFVGIIDRSASTPTTPSASTDGRRVAASSPRDGAPARAWIRTSHRDARVRVVPARIFHGTSRAAVDRSLIQPSRGVAARRPRARHRRTRASITAFVASSVARGGGDGRGDGRRAGRRRWVIERRRSDARVEER